MQINFYHHNSSQAEQIINKYASTHPALSSNIDLTYTLVTKSDNIPYPKKSKNEHNEVGYIKYYQ